MNEGRSFYVTVVSDHNRKEFASNGPASFKARLPEPLQVQGYQVGLAGVALPNGTGRVSKLYEGSKANYLFRYTGLAKVASTDARRSYRVTIDRSNVPGGRRGVEWMHNVVNAFKQGFFTQMKAGETIILDSAGQQGTVEFKWEGEELVLDGSKLKPYLIDHYMSIDATLALRMGWLVRNADKSYSLGPNLVLEIHTFPVKKDNDFHSPGMTTFFEVEDDDGVMFLSCAFSWRFVNLDTAFAEVTRSDPGAVQVYCNAGEPTMMGDQWTDLLSVVPYKGDATYWQPPQVQYRKVRSQVVQIVEVDVGELDGSLVNLSPGGRTVVVLHFRR